MSESPKRSVLVTGAARVTHSRLQFAAQGFRVFATARSLKTLSNLAEKGIETLTLDVTQPESIAALKSEIVSRTGGSLDILFNNAGALYEAPAIEADPARVRSLFNTNVFGLMEMVTAFTPLLLALVPSGHEPTIINVASVLARLPSPFTSAYNATKAAVAAYSDTLRLEVHPLGIRVVTLYMGEVSTPLMTTDNINFGSESIYRDAEAAVKQRTVTHLEKTMAPEQFAREVVGEIVDGKRSFLWKGSNAFTVWLLNAVGPRTVFDSAMVKAAGLDNKQTKASVFKLGQSTAGKMA
ncbi:Short-chain dehydrogenase/reductase SDR [Fusarium oxysporum f. sp. vasinfectum]|nr:Short-chain dehydrogenase/reductase SDR [Fusarium oxysporum f. sp. vasinfectum]KAK2925321.1 Short-chain dehydrogenase/reductase SDR [Fusarium oxysporum f. sp. vasinfectum]